jgi:hypothetical protein
MVTQVAGAYIPTGYEQQLGEIARKREIAEALQKQSLTVDNGQQSYITPFAKIAQALIAKSGRKSADEMERGVNQQRMADRQAAVERFQAAASPAPGADGTTAAPDYSAIINAIASTNDPMIAALAKPYMDAYGEKLKGGSQVKDVVSIRDPNDPTKVISVQRFGDGSLRQLPGIEAKDLENTNGVFTEKLTGMPVVQGPQDPTAPVIRGTPALGQVMGNFEVNPMAVSSKSAIAAAGRPTTNIATKFDVSTMDALGKAIPKAQIDGLSAGQTAAETYVQGRPALNRADAALSKGLINGFGANLRLDAARAGQLLGITGKDTNERITNSQTYLRETGQLLFPILQALRPASDTDVKTAQRMTAGDLSLTLGEMQRALRAAKSDGARVVARHNGKVKRYQQQYARVPEVANAIGTFEVLDDTGTMGAVTPDLSPADQALLDKYRPR